METVAINRPKLSDIVSDVIVQFILSNGLKPGDKLPSENELATKLGIGRTSVREGIRQLEANGLLTTRQGYGVTLNKVTIDMLFPSERKFALADFLVMSKKEILDLMELRMVIETDACRRAARNITAEGLQGLRRSLEDMVQTTGDPKAYIIPDMAFHKQIAIASGNVIYPRIFELISDLFRRQQSITASLPDAKNTASRFHKEICQALAQRDEGRAVAAMKNHLENTMSSIAENL
jgi:GntR family transcriptional repressor for pyruvate dehydrogenase complex